MKAMPRTCIAISELMVWGIGAKPVPSIGEDSTLKGILINGKPIKKFKADLLTYVFDVKGRAKKDLKVEAEANDIFAKIQIKMPDSIPGKATIIVTSEDGKHSQTYSIDFVKKR